MSDRRIPAIFISYSHDSPQHVQWVEDFAVRLKRLIECEVILDKWSYDRTLPWNAFMVESIWRSDIVILVCTEEYRAKAENLRGQSGVSREAVITLTDFYANPQKFIPVVREISEDGNAVVPYWLTNWDYVDFSAHAPMDDSFDKLCTEINRVWVRASPADLPEGTTSRSAGSAHELAARIRTTQSIIAGQFFKTFHLPDGTGHGQYLYVDPTIVTRQGAEKRVTAGSEAIHDFTISEQKVYLLVGEYGSGKSSLAQYAAVAREMSDTGGEIYITVTCRANPECDPDNFSAWLDSTLRTRHTVGNLRYSWRLRFEDLAALQTHYRVVLVVDGLDELSVSPAWTPESTLAALIDQACEFSWKTILTGRDIYLGALYEGANPMRRAEYADARQLKRLWSNRELTIGFMQPFDDAQISQYFSSSATGGDIGNPEELPPDVASLARKPVFAQLLADSPELIQNRRLRKTDLYDNIVTDWIGSRSGIVLDTKASISVLEEIAFTMFVANRREVSISFIERCAERCLPSLDPHTVATELIIRSILIVSADGSAAFSHSTIMEYLVACRLARRLEKFDNSETYVRLLTVPINAFIIELLENVEADAPYISGQAEYPGEMVFLNVPAKAAETLELEEGSALLGKNAVTCTQYLEFLKANPNMLPPRSEGRELLYQLGTRADVDWFVQDVELYLAACERLCWSRDSREPPAGMSEHPVYYVSWYDAWAYCRWTGTSLPSYSEWSLAGYWDPANEEWTEHPVAGTPDPGRNCNCMNVANGTVPVSEMPDARSAMGCRHMLGNVAEWTATWSDDAQSYKVIAGGGWMDDAEAGAFGNPGISFPNIRRNFVGFRVLKRL
jgi:energy-coupling factor transporter ATP-binding protein EcfA2